MAISKASHGRLLQGLEDLALALDPATAAAKAEWDAQELARRIWEHDDRHGRAGKSGWRKGQPQCPGCRRLLSAKDGYCPNCRTYAGRQSHGRS